MPTKKFTNHSRTPAPKNRATRIDSRIKAKVEVLKEKQKELHTARKDLHENLKDKSKEDREALIAEFKEANKAKHEEIKAKAKEVKEEIRALVETEATRTRIFDSLAKRDDDRLNETFARSRNFKERRIVSASLFLAGVQLAQPRIMISPIQEFPTKKASLIPNSIDRNPYISFAPVLRLLLSASFAPMLCGQLSLSLIHRLRCGQTSD